MKKNLKLLLVFVALGLVAIWVYKRNPSSTLSDQPLMDFGIPDTSTVTRIFIVDHNGQSVLLERNPAHRLWSLNGKYKARKDATDLILETLCRLRVRGNVPIKGKENILRVLASSGKKVEVYQGGNKPSKIYYVGPATPDHVGTFMLLEIPGIGRSPDPYITHMEGFTGFLTPRFFADEMEWRYTGVFDFPGLGFRTIDVVFHTSPENSFRVEYDGEESIALRNGYNPISGNFQADVPRFDTLRVQDLLLSMRKIHLESYNTYLKPEAADSIRKTIPLITVSVKDKNGKTHIADLYPKRGREPRLNSLGVLTPWDPEYYWVRTTENELGLGQMFVFDPIIQPLSWFLGVQEDPLPGIVWIK